MTEPTSEKQRTEVPEDVLGHQQHPVRDDLDRRHELPRDDEDDVQGHVQPPRDLDHER